MAENNKKSNNDYSVYDDNQRRLRSNTALVLIGGRGQLGMSIGRQYLESGGRVIATSRTPESGMLVGLDTRQLDLTSTSSIKRFVSGITEDLGDSELIIITVASGFVGQSSCKDIKAVKQALSVTFTGSVTLLTALLCSKLNIKSVSIICSYGVHALKAERSSAAHIAAKAGLAAFGVALDRSLNVKGPAINLIFPSTLKKSKRDGVDVDWLAAGILDRAMTDRPSRGVVEWTLSND